MKVVRVLVTYKALPYNITVEGIVQKYNLQEFRNKVDPVLSVRGIPNQKGIDLYYSQVVSVEEIE